MPNEIALAQASHNLTRVDFNFGMPPFDQLGPDERENLLGAVQTCTYQAGSIILWGSDGAEHLYVVDRGQVEERDGFETIAVRSAGDFFATRALFATPIGNHFVAIQATRCHLIPHGTVLDLVRRNRAFGDILIRRHAQRMIARSTTLREREISAIGMLRVRNAVTHRPLIVDPSTALGEVAAQMRADGVDVALVRRDGRVRLVTGRLLRDAVLIDGRDRASPVGSLPTQSAPRLHPEQGVLDALALFGDHSTQHILVGPDDGAIDGVVEQGDILEVLADRSDIIAGRVDHAQHPVALAKTVTALDRWIGMLVETGVDSHLIANLVTDLNRRIFQRVYEMVVPAEVLATSCLIVMGSEGRGEQVIRTDQDNGLILADDYRGPPIRKLAEEFTEHLIHLGYPPCPGNIMVSNPDWCLSVREWAHRVRNWVLLPDETALLNLAIFYDAASVAGDSTLLTQVRKAFFDRLTDNRAFFSHFARIALAFDDQPSRGGLTGLLFGEKRPQPVDIKKAGIFPIVHGVRALALEQRLTVTSTDRRLAALASAGVLEQDLAQDLVESLFCLQRLRTRMQVRRAGSSRALDNAIDYAALSGLERAQFDAAMANVRKLKATLIHRYHLNMFE